MTARRCLRERCRRLIVTFVAVLVGSAGILNTRPLSTGFARRCLDPSPEDAETRRVESRLDPGACEGEGSPGVVCVSVAVCTTDDILRIDLHKLCIGWKMGIVAVTFEERGNGGFACWTRRAQIDERAAGMSLARREASFLRFVAGGCSSSHESVLCHPYHDYEDPYDITPQGEPYLPKPRHEARHGPE